MHSNEAQRAIQPLSVIVIIWGLMAILVGTFVDLRFTAIGFLQVGVSVLVLLLSSRLKDKRIRAFIAVYLAVLFLVCSLGAIESYADALPAAFFFGSIAIYAGACFCLLYWNGKLQEH